MSAHHPVHEIDVVVVLLDDLVAADPDERIPVTVLPLHVAPLRIAFLGMENGPRHVMRVAGADVADRPVADALDGFDVAALRMPLTRR